MNVLNRPMPHPSLKSLSKLLGSWNVSGEAHGQVTYKWMEGGFFMVQDIDIIGTRGIEFIGCDERSGRLRSHYFDSGGHYLEYVYLVTETDYIVSIDMPGIKGQFRGKFSSNGLVITGNWNLTNGGKASGYDVMLTKISL